VPGTSLATGALLGLVPPQLDLALAAPNKPKLLIMDGGGNDILLCDTAQFPDCATICSTAGSSTAKVCQDIAQAAFDAATAVITKAGDAGVTDKIYFFYPHIPDPGGGAGFDEILDYAEPLAKAVCDAAVMVTHGKLTCHFVSTTAAFAAAGGEKNPTNFSIDGIHPSAAGQTIIATQIWNTMKADCLGQTSGCCE
jgi:lysophospholipase L1-like esterase